MIGKEALEKIKQLKDIGYSSAYISRELGLSYPTVRKYLQTASIEIHAVAVQKRISPLVAPFENRILEYLKSGICSSRKIERLLKIEGYGGSYPLLNAYIKYKKEQQVAKKTASYFRVETSPGEQAQADWGHFGKIEASVKFIRNNFFQGEKFGKTFFSLEDLNAKLLLWLNEYANSRKHPAQATTVSALWREERKTLSSTIDFDISLVAPQIRHVSQISMVNYKRASYWVPQQYIRHKIEVREVARNGQIFLEFYDKGEKIYEYIMAAAGSWILPDNPGIIKLKNKRSEIEERVKNHPAYRTKVAVRNLGYYSRLVDQ